MMKNAFILNFFKLYNMLWKLALPFLKKNKRLRSGFKKRITCFHLSKADVWIQAASAGEAYLAVNILQKLKPETTIKVLVTSTTSQGIDILNSGLSSKNISRSIDLKIDLKIDLFPFDAPCIIQDAVKIINPGIMVLLETEIWPALFYFLKKNQTRIFIVNARLSKNSFNNYMKTRFLWKHLTPDTILATSDQYAQRYKQVFEKAMVKTMKNIKFESLEIETHNSKAQRQIAAIITTTLPLTILASIRRQEEKQALLILKDILKNFPNQIVAVFPRHMHRIDAWKKLLTSQKLNYSLRSKTSTLMTTPGIILWDTFGELKAAYGLASIVFVGGSLKPLGGQNFIEPAQQGAVTITGPYYDDFAWVTEDIFNKELVIKQNSWKAVSQTIQKTLKNPANRSERILLAQKFIKSKQGGTRQVCDEILKAFDGLVSDTDHLLSITPSSSCFRERFIRRSIVSSTERSSKRT